MIKKAVTLIFCLMLMVLPKPLVNAQGETEAMREIPIEAVISYPERLEGTEFVVYGYIKRVEEGMLLYQSQNDYQYDTRENSILLIMNEEQKQLKLPVDGLWSFSGVMNVRIVDGQITGDVYEGTYDEMKAPQIPKQEGGEVEETSIYRILGNPWEYNGKHVRYEAIMGSDFYSTENTATQIMSQDGTKEGLYQEMEKKYGLEDGELRLIGTIGQARFYLTGRMSIYMGSCYGMSYLEGIELHEKDVERLDELKQKTRDFLKERFPEYYGEEE